MCLKSNMCGSAEGRWKKKEHKDDTRSRTSTAIWTPTVGEMMEALCIVLDPFVRRCDID